jgi:hypothetical protein
MFAWMPRSRPSMSAWPASTPTQGICMRRPSRTTTTSPQSMPKSIPSCNVCVAQGGSHLSDLGVGQGCID